MMGKKKDEKKPACMTYHTTNVVLKDKKLPEARVTQQLAAAPAPHDKGDSGYPHKYTNREKIIERNPGSTGSLYEYPITQTGPAYNFGFKPKGDPGPFRAVTNNTKALKGVIAHNGDAKAEKANAGFFHRCEKK